MYEKRIFRVAYIRSDHLFLTIVTYKFGYNHDALFLIESADDAGSCTFVLQRIAHFNHLYSFIYQYVRFSQE